MTSLLLMLCGAVAGFCLFALFADFFLRRKLDFIDAEAFARGFKEGRYSVKRDGGGP